METQVITYHNDIRQNSVFSIPRFWIALLFISSTFLFFIVYVIAESGSPFFRQLFNICGPVFTFIAINCLTLFLLYKNIESKNFVTIYLFTFLTAILGIFTAFSLNSRIIYSIAILANDPSIITSESAQVNLLVFFVAFLVPLVEEFAKAYPMLILSRQISVNPQSGKESRLASSPKLFLLIAILSGSVFNMVESYWYSWNVGSLSLIQEDEHWFEISSQIILRSINLLHVFATICVGVAIALTFNGKVSNYLDRSDTNTVVFGFLIAVTIHGLWNGIATYAAVYPSNFIWISFFKIQLPIIMVILIALSLIGVSLIIYWGMQWETKVCTTCHNWHTGDLPHGSISHSPINNYENIVNLQNEVFRCRYCQLPKPDEVCTNCGTPEVFMCSNCDYPLPVYANKCWRCGVDVENVFDSILKFPENQFSKFTRYYPILITSIFLPHTFSLILGITQGQIKGVGQVPNQLLLYLIVSTSLAVATYSFLKPENKQLGIILGRYMLGLTILLLFFLFIALASYSWILVQYVSSRYLFTGTVLLIFSIGLAYIAYFLLKVPIGVWRDN